MARKSTVDWELVEVDFRAGIKTLQQLANEYGVTRGRISQVASERGWTRDLKDKINQRAQAKVIAAVAASKQGGDETKQGPCLATPEPKQAGRQDPSKPKKVREELLVDQAATAIAEVLVEHKTAISRSRGLFNKLLSEVEAVTDKLDLFERLGEMMDAGGEDDSGKRIADKMNDLYAHIISTSGRVDNAKKLSEMLERLVKLERQTYGIDDKKGAEDNEVDALLRKIAEEMRK